MDGKTSRPERRKSEKRRRRNHYPFDTIVDQSLSDIETWNNMPHSVHTNKTRWEVFCEMQNKKYTTHQLGGNPSSHW